MNPFERRTFADSVKSLLMNPFERRTFAEKLQVK
jgi:hypothetical protein